MSVSQNNVINKNLINGEWQNAVNGKTIAVTNPANNAILTEVPWCGEVETLDAIDAANKALPKWAALTPSKRCRILMTLCALIRKNKERLAILLTSEQGKPLPEARGEIAYGVSLLEWAAEEGKRIYGELIPARTADRRIMVMKQPVGVCAMITPWNFPNAMITRKLGPALAAGCTVVLKPSELTPLSALALGELALEAGIPKGVFNIITGDANSIGDTLLADKRVRKLSFTGSTRVGRLLMAKSAQNITRLSLELGGQAPFIVFADADVSRAVSAVMESKFRNMGQTCISANRFFIHDDIYDNFITQLTTTMQNLTVGPGLEANNSIGPLINDAALTKVQHHVDEAVAKGATLLMGGQPVALNNNDDSGRFFPPTLLENITPDMVISMEETFGPVVGLQRFNDERAVIAAANNTPYGLAAYFFTRDAARLMRVSEQLEFGIIGANDGSPSTAQAPFGGLKHSGIGREGGHHVMAEYTETKYVSWQL